MSATFCANESFGEESSSVVIGGAFTRIGNPRLALFDAGTSSWHGPSIPASGIRAVHFHASKLYVAGDFTHLAGQPRQGLARFSCTPQGIGALDTEWAPKIIGTITAIIGNGEHIFVGGSFTTIDGQPRRNLARISTADGTIGTWKADTDGAVHVIATTVDDIVIGGAFVTVNDESHVRLARIQSATGKVIAAFTAAADSDVRSLVVKQNKLIIGGQFSRINAEDRLALARLELATGDVDPAWRADVDGAVLSLSAENDRLYVGGAFTTIASQARANCARIQITDGAVDSWQADTNEQVSAICDTGSDRIFIAGRFTEINNVASNGLVVVSAQTGAVDRTWRAPGLIPNNPVSGLSLKGNLLAVASDVIDGPVRAGIAMITGDGVIAPWQLALGGSRNSVSSSVVHNGYRYIGGDFSLVGNQPRLNLARIDLTTGEVDSKWRSDANGPVRAMMVQGNDLVIAGDFTALGTTPRGYIGKISLADGSVTPWEIVADGPISTLRELDGAIFIAGSFQNLGGKSHRGIGRITNAGIVDPSFIAQLTLGDTPGIGCALSSLGAKQLLVGGRFDAVTGTPAGNCALLNSDTGAVLPWQATADGPVYALAVTSDSTRVVLGGGFTAVAKEPRARLAMVDGLTGKPLAWRVDADFEVRTLVMRGDTLWMGGDFTELNHQPAYHVGRCRLIDGVLLSCTSADERVDVITP